MSECMRVCGQGIKLQKFPRHATRNCNVKEIVLNAPAKVAQRQFGKADHFSKREVYKVNVKNYTNANVCNKQLREIYEAVELDDFKRFLVKAPVLKKNVPSNQSLSTIYRENFEVHYIFLKQLIKKSHKTSE